MGLAEEFDDEGDMDEHIQRFTDAEKEVENLRAALESERKKLSAAGAGDLCQIEKCNRHVDWWCDLCKSSICQKCSKDKCAVSAAHSLKEFDKVYQGVKVKFVRWRDECEEMFVLLEHRQKKLMRIIREKEKEVSEARDESHGKRGDRMIEIGELHNKLEPLSKQVEDLKCNLAAYGDQIDRLNRPDFFSVINDLLDRLHLSASSSASPPPSSNSTSPPTTSTTSPPPASSTSTASSSSSPAKPSGLQFLSEHETGGKQCNTVTHTQSGDILVGCSDGLKILNRVSGKVTNVNISPSATVTEYKGEVFILTWHPSKKELVIVYEYNMETQAKTMVFTYPVKSNLAARLTVSDKYLACIDRDNINIKLCERRSGDVTTIQLPEFTMIYNLLLVSDEYLLVTGYDPEKGMTKKYRLSEKGEPTLVWSCDVPKACGLSVADNGLVYVSRMNYKTIYILRGEGQMWIEMKHDKLPDYYENISIRGNELAVAGWKAKKVLLFTIK